MFFGMRHLRSNGPGLNRFLVCGSAQQQSSAPASAGAVSIGRLFADHPVAAAMFGLIERLVCSGDHPVGQLMIPRSRAFGRQHGYSDRDGEIDRMSGRRIYVLFCNAAAYPFRDLAGMVHVGLRQEYDKLLSAIAGDRVAHPQLGLDEVGHAHQHFIARLMAIAVVDALELVDVEEHAGQRMLVAACLADFNLAAVFEVTAVLNPGQRISQPELLQAFLREGAFQAPLSNTNLVSNSQVAVYDAIYWLK